MCSNTAGSWGGDCPEYRLFEAVEVQKKDGVIYPRRYQDYMVQIHKEQIPDSVEVPADALTPAG